MLAGNATTERALRCLTSAVQHGSGYGNAPTRRGGGDHVSKDKRGLGERSSMQSPPSCTRGLTAAAPGTYGVSI